MRYTLGQLCAAATPLALGGIVEELQISVIAMFAAHLGMAQLGAHYGAMRVLLVLQAVNYGLVQATAVRIGGHLLDRNVPSAKHVMRICLVLSAVWGSVVGGAFYLARRYVGFIFR
jgi:Na+-driven multidrug efflux pump